MTPIYRVGISADFKTEAAGVLEPILAEYFTPRPEVAWEFLAEENPIFTPEQLCDLDALITLHPKITEDSLRRVERLAVISRWGVGYDMIDVPACTAHDILVAITRDAVRPPVAEGILTLMLALARRVLRLDALVRTGRWNDKTQYASIGLAGRTVGTIGVGNIGAELVHLLRPFGLARILAFDPFVSPARAEELGIELVSLDMLLRESDFVCINCPLTPDTRHLIGEYELRQMRPSAFLINTARGAIVDQMVLTRALREQWIAGAALDVFEQEPVAPDDPLLALDNVILSPHAIAWTDALVRGNGAGACENVLTILRGQVPQHTVNSEVVERPGFRAKLDALRVRGNVQ